MQRKINTDLSFFLKQVDPVSVARRYLANELKMPTTKVKFDNTTLTSDLEVGSSPNDEIYEVKDKNGELIRIITTDHKNWTQEWSASPIGPGTVPGVTQYRCHRCLIEHTGPYLVTPIKIERDPAGKLIIHGTGTFCCFECVYGHLKTKWYSSTYTRNYLYSDSETLLRFLYHLLTGKNDLKASPDWTLHQKHGGRLSDKDYYSPKTIYVPAPNVLLCTLKTMYVVSK